MRYTIILFFCGIGLCPIFAQTYSDYIGAGHFDNVTVTTSSVSNNSLGENTINGSGLDARRFEASRFLGEATFGYTHAEINALAENLDFETWIDDQFLKPVSPYLTRFWTLWDELVDFHVSNGGNAEDIGPGWIEFNYTWWQNMMVEEDQLRQRMAHALSQIFVISNQSDISQWPWGMSDYYDVLNQNALGNYKDLMLDVTLHPMMGYYLSHLNNPKTIAEENIHPDENYAREIMQLFSIGLYELNNDGSEKLDVDGNLIPTYDQDDIKELAKVFTGLGSPSFDTIYYEELNDPFFGMSIWDAQKTGQMIMYDEWHELGDKIIVGDELIPGGQTGMQDVEDAVEILFQHDNVGPFVCRQLIQRFVSSNPSPEYISRVVDVFNDNGSGVRGDLASVIKQILLDDEARSCQVLTDDNAGRMREPILRYTQLCKGIETDSPYGRYWNNGYDFYESSRQHPMMSPSVFNFYPPNYQPQGALEANNLVAPEFKLHDTRTAITNINRIQDWISWNNLMYSWVSDDPNITLVTTVYEDLADDPETMLNEYDILFTHGQLSDQTRGFIRESLSEFMYGNYAYDRARTALFLLLFSPDYMIAR